MKKLRVFLGNAPWRKPGFYGVRAGSRWPHFEGERMEYMPFPFFLAYAAALVEGDGFPTLLVDGIAEGLDDDAFFARIHSFKPDLILFEVSTNSIETDLRILKRARGEFPAALLVLAGLHNDMFRPEFLAQHPDADMILVGEYEFTLLDVARHLNVNTESTENKKFKSSVLSVSSVFNCVAGMPGVLVRENGLVTDGGRRPIVEDLSLFPWPARHFLPMQHYRDEPGGLPRPSAQMWASRGCPYGCIFCAWPQIMYDSRRYRVRPVVDVVDEMEWLGREYGFKSVYFDDDTFNVGKERMLAFAREVRGRNMDLPFGVMARADLMDREILTALREAGLWGLKYGVESADQPLLDRAGKGLDIQKVREAVAITHELGIRTHLTFMFGLPGETRETARRTIDLAIECAAESVQFTVATPYPGSRYWEEIQAAGKLTSTDFNRYDGFRSAVVRTDELSSRDLEDILVEANRKWTEFRAGRNVE